jgi:hypothetical protein
LRAFSHSVRVLPQEEAEMLEEVCLLRTAVTGHLRRSMRLMQRCMGFLRSLWLHPAEYKHVVLGLIFLKYISDAFKEKREQLKRFTADPSSDLYSRTS